MRRFKANAEGDYELICANCDKRDPEILVKSYDITRHNCSICGDPLFGRFIVRPKIQCKDIPLKLILQLIYNHQTTIFTEKEAPYAYRVLIQDMNFPPAIVYAKYDKLDLRGYLDCGVSLRTGWLTKKGIDKLKELGGYVD